MEILRTFQIQEKYVLSKVLEICWLGTEFQIGNHFHSELQRHFSIVFQLLVLLLRKIPSKLLILYMKIIVIFLKV